MERDFMGIRSKIVKEEIDDDFRDLGRRKRSPGMQWSFSNKVTALPQFLSFKAAKEEKSKKIFQSSSSSEFMTKLTADASEANQKPNSVIAQLGNHYALTAYPLQQFNANSIIHPQDMRMFIPSQTNQTVPVVSSPLLHSNHANPVSSGLNVVSSTINSHSLGGLPAVAPVSTVDTSELKNATKPAGSSAQLTIFYAGSVNVYNDITPEKAQAIMLLAGSGVSGPQNTLPAPQVQKLCSMGDNKNGNQPCNASPFSCLSSPIPLISPGGSLSGGSNCTKEVAIFKTVGAILSSSSQPEASTVVNTIGSACANLCSTVALPQARKASLARFLEKRKERVANSSPYTVNKKSLERSTPGSESLSLSIGSPASCSFPALKYN